MKKNNILLKKVTSNLNDDEEILFQEWLQKSVKNKLLYKKLLFLKQEKDFFKGVSELDTNAAWELVQEKSKQKPSPKLVFRKRIIKFSVAASILLLISLSVIYTRTDFFSSPTEALPIIVNNNIKVGTDKAILTLEDGTKVALEKGQRYIKGNLESTGEDLVYSKSKEAKSVIVYNYLTIPRGGQYHVVLSDGTEVWLNSESQIKYPVAFIEGVDRQIELVYGEAFFDVSPSSEHKGATFKVSHHNQEVEVLGTQFNIRAYKDERNIYTTLVEGSVAIAVGKQRQHLKPNEQSNLELDSNSLTISAIDANKEIAWKEGVFNFDSKGLKDIMVVLSRWYDMDVVFDNKKLEKQKFMGLINKGYSIEDILAVMKDTNVISSYTINNKTIILK